MNGAVVLFLFFACFAFATVAEKVQNDAQPTEFNAVLATLVQQGMDHLAEYKPVKKAIKSLRQELKYKKIDDDIPEQKRKKKAKVDAGEWTGAVENLMDTVDTFFGDNLAESNRVRTKEASEVADIFAEFMLFKADLKAFRVNYGRIYRMFSLTMELMSRRPKLRENIAGGITQLLGLPESYNVAAPLAAISQGISMWNSPVGQKLVKPVLDNMLVTLKNSNFDVNTVKPSVDAILMSVFGPDTNRQLKPIVDIVFAVANRVMGIVRLTGLGDLMNNFDSRNMLVMAQNLYVEIFLDMIKPLHDVIENSEYVSKGLENVMDVTRRYRHIPGTMDVRFRRGDFNDPVAKVKSVLVQLERAKSEIEESRDAIVGMHAYPLHHPSQAIDAIKLLLVTLDGGQQALNDFWPLRGFLATHPIVKGYKDLDSDVEELKTSATRAIDRTHKVQVLIDDVKNMDSIFDMKQIYEDVRNIIVGYPKMGMVVILLDLVKGELDKIKEIAYNGI